MGLVFGPDGDASWGERLWPSCKYLTVLWCCPCQMSALNNSDYTSHSLHSWRNRSMWHLDAAATLVSFSGISFEGSFFFFFFFGGGLKLFIGFFTQLFIKGTSGALGKFHVMARYIQTSITKNMRCLEKAKAKYSNVRSIPTQASFPTAYMIQRGSVVT